MSNIIGEIAHEDLTVRVVDAYDLDDTDHVIHLTSPSWMRNVVPTDPDRAIFQLSPREALALIKLLLSAVEEAG